MGITTLVLANLFGRWTRSALTISGVAVAVGAVVALVGISRGFERSLIELHEGRGIDLIVQQAGKAVQHSSTLPGELAAKIAELPGVSQSSPILHDVVSIGDVVGITVQGLPTDSFMFEEYEMLSGRTLEPGDAEPVEGAKGNILIGEKLASAMSKQVGDTIEVLEEAPFRVVGVFRSFNPFENGSIVMPLSALQKLLLRNNELTMVFVKAREHDRPALDKLRGEIKQAAHDIDFPSGVDATPARELAENSQEIRMVRSMAWLTSSIALLVGSIGMLNTMLMAVFERTREIAMLRAIGWRKSRIVGLILRESLILSLVGAAVGTVMAVLLTWQLSRMPASGRLVSGEIAPEVMVQGFVIAVGVGLLGGVYPAYRASRLLPVEGLRHD